MISAPSAFFILYGLVHSLEKTVTELRERIAILERYLETKEEERKSLEEKM